MYNNANFTTEPLTTYFEPSFKSIKFILRFISLNSLQLVNRYSTASSGKISENRLCIHEFEIKLNFCSFNCEERSDEAISNNFTDSYYENYYNSVNYLQ